MNFFKDLQNLLWKYRALDRAGIVDSNSDEHTDIYNVTIPSTANILETKPFRITTPFRHLYYVDGPDTQAISINVILGSGRLGAQKSIPLQVYDSLCLDYPVTGCDIFFTNAYIFNEKPLRLLLSMNTRFVSGSITPRKYGSIQVYNAGGYVDSYNKFPGEFTQGTTIAGNTIPAGTRQSMAFFAESDYVFLSNYGPGTLFIGGDNVGDNTMDDPGFLIPKGTNIALPISRSKMYGYASGGNVVYGGAWMHY